MRSRAAQMLALAFTAPCVALPQKTISTFRTFTTTVKELQVRARRDKTKAWHAVRLLRGTHCASRRST